MVSAIKVSIGMYKQNYKDDNNGGADFKESHICIFNHMEKILLLYILYFTLSIQNMAIEV